MSKIDAIEIGSRLRDARKAAGFRFARAFAEEIGIDPTRYSQYERGARGFLRDLSLLLTITQRLDVTADWLLFGEEAAGTPSTAGRYNSGEILGEITLALFRATEEAKAEQLAPAELGAAMLAVSATLAEEDPDEGAADDVVRDRITIATRQIIKGMQIAGKRD